MQSKKKTRGELLKDIDVDYYGYLDDEDNLLVPKEQKCEAEARQRLIDEFNQKLLSGEIARLAQSEQDEDEEVKKTF
jgi:pre-mRNA-splicing factor ISY1